MSPAAGHNSPIVKQIILLSKKLSFRLCSHVATIRIHQKEVRSELTYCESGFEPSVLQTLMYDIPLISKFTPINICFVSFQLLVPNRTGRREVIEKLTSMSLLKLNAIKPYCCTNYQISYIFICYVIVLRISPQFLVKAGYCN